MTVESAMLAQMQNQSNALKNQAAAQEKIAESLEAMVPVLRKIEEHLGLLAVKV